MTTNIQQHNIATITVIFFSFNKVSHIRRACSPPSALQPLQSVCQPSFIQPEIFLSVGSLLSLNGTPPTSSPPQGRTFHYLSFWHPALSSTVHRSEIYWMCMVTPAPGFCAAPLLSEFINSMFPELRDECASFTAFNQSCYSTFSFPPRFRCRFLGGKSHTSTLIAQKCDSRMCSNMKALLYVHISDQNLLQK